VDPSRPLKAGVVASSFHVAYAQSSYAILQNICVTAGCPDGLQPAAGLIQAPDGTLYGTTFGGGTFGARDGLTR